MSKIGGHADQGHFWWKALSDGQIFHPSDDMLETACRVIWDRMFHDRAFKEHASLRAFGYFLQMEVQSSKKLKLI